MRSCGFKSHLPHENLLSKDKRFFLLLDVSYLVGFYLILFGIEGVITACSGLGDLW